MNKIGYIIAISILLILYVPIFPAGFWINPPTGSMRPAITGCDITFYGPPDAKEGDVMMYWRSDDTLIMHRIIEETDDGYIFKGDNREERDRGVIKDEHIQAELYYTIDVPIDRSTCADITRTPYNVYYSIVGGDYTLKSSSVNESGLK